MDKGSKGYLANEKRKHLLYGFGFIVAFIVIYVSGILLTGTNKNYGTIMAVLVALPAAQMLSKYFSIKAYKPLDNITSQIHDEGGLFNLMIVFEKSVYYLDHVHVGPTNLLVLMVQGDRLKQERARVKLALKTIMKHKGIQVPVKVCTNIEEYLSLFSSNDCIVLNDKVIEDIRQILLRNSL